MEPEKVQEILNNLLLAGFILFIIMLPRFCFKVSDKDYKLLKE